VWKQLLNLEPELRLEKETFANLKNIYVRKLSFIKVYKLSNSQINSLNAKLNPISHLLALIGAHHILHVSRIRVKYNEKIQ